MFFFKFITFEFSVYDVADRMVPTTMTPSDREATVGV